MKYSQWIGVAATVVLAASSFFAWTWHPDLNKFFTGFFSEKQVYGKPGMVFIFLGSIAMIFFLIPKLWAKRWNFAIGALIVAYAIKTFILYTGCYNGICPVKQPAIWLMLISAVLTLVMAVLPDTKTPDKQPGE
jgi:hypothetical protein